MARASLGSAAICPWAASVPRVERLNRHHSHTHSTYGGAPIQDRDEEGRSEVRQQKDSAEATTPYGRASVRARRQRTWEGGWWGVKSRLGAGICSVEVAGWGHGTEAAGMGTAS